MEQILVERPAPIKLEVLGVEGWPLKTLQIGQYKHQYIAAQECFLFDGEVQLSLQDSEQTLTLQAGDFFIIPRNSTVEWSVIQSIEYCYHDLDHN